MSLPIKISRPANAIADPAWLTFGVTEGGLAQMSMADEEAHILAVGRTGGGKTAFIRAICRELSDIGAMMVLIDPKIGGMRGLEALPGVEGRYTALDITAMCAAIEGVKTEMFRRCEAINEGADPESFPHLALVIDEAVSLYTLSKDHWNAVELPARVAHAKVMGLPTPAGRGEHPSFRSLRTIISMGREARIHVVLITQQADASWLGSDARGNFGVRVALGELPAVSERQMFESGANLPPLPTHDNGSAIKGRARMSVGGGAPVDIQVYWTEPLPAVVRVPVAVAAASVVAKPRGWRGMLLRKV